MVILMMCLHLLGNTEMYQLLAVPKVFAHFQIHQLMNPDKGFFSFIAEHYMGDDGIVADDSQDHELPFLHVSVQNLVHAVTPPQAVRMQLLPKKILPDLKGPCGTVYTLQGYPGHLFRPPIC